MMFNQLLAGLAAQAAAVAATPTDAYPEAGYPGPAPVKTCQVEAAPEGCDSAPAIIEAFEQCGHNEGDARGRVVFGNTTYHVKTVMNTTGLRNVDVDIQGTLLWDTNLPYWLNNSLPVGYQNQSSAWLFGGESVSWDGHGYGTLDGNGQAWYDFINGTNNYPGRPHSLTITGTSDSYFTGVRFVQSQMWTMTIIHSHDIVLEDMYVNSTDTEHPVDFEFSSLNTDGADTVYADNITFRRWIVDNGDDSIAMKANSTNILIEDCKFYTGLGVAIGSIGQYEGRFETVENVTARNIEVYHMRYGAYVKTWTGISTGYPPNGGGGGLGYAANITLQNFTLFGDTTGVFALTQCTSYNSATGNCDTSEFNIRDLRLLDWRGECISDVVAEIQCSAASPCTGMQIEGIDIVDTVNGTAPVNYLCSNVDGPIGYECTGKPWGENNR